MLLSPGLAYHYHAQIFTAITSGNKATTDGTALYATTTGKSVSTLFPRSWLSE